MTYGVPYSFVPGTKARADEVNANFIEVLNKIEETNTRVDESNTRIDDANTKADANKEEIEKKLTDGLAKKAGVDLANLSTAGKAVLNAKANASDIDGKWIKSSKTILNNVTISGNAKTWTYDLSSLLPKDNNVYEVLLQVLAEKKGGGWALYYLASSLCDYLTIVSTGTNSAVGTGAFFIPIGTNRKLYIKSSTNGGGSTMMFFNIRAYRKVR